MIILHCYGQYIDDVASQCSEWMDLAILDCKEARNVEEDRFSAGEKLHREFITYPDVHYALACSSRAEDTVQTPPCSVLDTEHPSCLGNPIKICLTAFVSGAQSDHNHTGATFTCHSPPHLEFSSPHFLPHSSSSDAYNPLDMLLATRLRGPDWS